MLNELSTASNVFPPNGSRSLSSSTSRVRLISWLKGSSASRYSIAREESAAVMWETREDNGSDVVFEGSGSGSGRVRARAILQEFAPRSRTWLNVRFMSY